MPSDAGIWLGHQLRAPGTIRSSRRGTPTTRRASDVVAVDARDADTRRNTYTGDIYVDSGPPFSDFDRAARTPTKAGTGTLTFTDANNGSFGYKSTCGAGAVIPDQDDRASRVRRPSRPAPKRTTPNLAARHQLPGSVVGRQAAEDGWGINFAHQGNTIVRDLVHLRATSGARRCGCRCSRRRRGTTATLHRDALPYVGPAIRRLR